MAFQKVELKLALKEILKLEKTSTKEEELGNMYRQQILLAEQHVNKIIQEFCKINNKKPDKVEKIEKPAAERQQPLRRSKRKSDTSAEVFSEAPASYALRKRTPEPVLPPQPPEAPLLKLNRILLLNDTNFKEMFHMDRNTIQRIADILETKGIDSFGDIDKRLYMSLWLLTNQRTYEQAEEVFGISDIDDTFYDYCKQIVKFSPKFIFWPKQESADKIVDAFEKMYGFPGVIGVIGNLHVKIKEDSDNVELLNESNEYTIILQAVCDHFYLFRDVCVGFPGSMNAENVLKTSPIYKRLISKSNPLITASSHRHILGDSSYPQLTMLLTPYNVSEGKIATEKEFKFNMMHNIVRVTIDRAFELFLARFPRLKCLDVTCEQEKATLVVGAACVLHNLTIMLKDKYPD